MYMKQKSIIALFLSAVLVITLSSAETAFASYDDKYEEEYEKDHDSAHEKDHDKYDDDDDDDDYDDDDKYEREGRS